MIGSRDSFVGNSHFGGHLDFSFYPENIMELKVLGSVVIRL